MEMKRSGCYEKSREEVHHIYFFSISFSYEGTKAFAFVPFLLQSI
ncbi:hypothetical protein [Bacillus mycoides]|nr:hypothetical protein [Bacillus mycoides]